MRSSHSLLAVLALATVLAGCGGAEKAAETQQTPTTTEEPRPTNGLTGDWREQAGQSDKIEKALKSDGFECSKHASERLDLRMCMKALPVTAEDRFGASARIRLMADGKGTVVRAAVDGSAAGKEGRKLRTQVLKSLLSEEDVAVVEAGGGKIGWGAATKSEGALHFLVKGGEAAQQAVTQPMVEMTKEQALPKFQSAGLKCTVDDKTFKLLCSDPDFEVDGDTSTLGVRNESEVFDGGQGIMTFMIRGSNSKTPQNAAAVKHLVPTVLGVTDKQGIADVRKWVESHLDGLPHSAYVGDWGVSVEVGIDTMFGDSVTVSVGAEKDTLGAKSK